MLQSFMRVALVHDYLNQLGGAERVFREIARLFPEAPVYTILSERAFARSLLPGRTIVTSFLDRLPWLRRHHYYGLWLMPLAIEQFDFSDYDLVISSSSSFAKGILTGPETLHLSYVATPLRYVWEDYYEERERFPLPRVLSPLVGRAVHYVRLWDALAARRPDAVATNSVFSSRRIAKYYRRTATVIHPPVDCGKFRAARPAGTAGRSYFLMVGRLTPYKRFDIAIEAFKTLPDELWIVGDGPDRRRLGRLAGANVRFLGRVAESALPGLYANAAALIFPQEEHFGLVAVEAMAAGTPVIALAAGGALETVAAGVSGVFFDEQSPESLTAAVERFDRSAFDAERIRAEALQFDTPVFQKKFLEFVSAQIASRSAKYGQSSASIQRA
ncbi:MAG: glycosyltransferase [Patescibacteria group bacterium]|nr:glycosyltransferase [Patescibacteria group bacterium]